MVSSVYLIGVDFKKQQQPFSMLQYEPTVLAQNLPFCQMVSACDRKFGSVSQYCPCYLIFVFVLFGWLLFFPSFLTLCLPWTWVNNSFFLFFFGSRQIPVCFSDLYSTRNECFALSEEKLRKEKGKLLYIVYSLLSAVVQVFFNCSGFDPASLVEASEAGQMV